MSAMIIPIVALLIPMVIVPTALGIKFSLRVRELEHAERMKALELGRTLPRDEPWWGPARISVAIGAGVPVGALLCAVMGSQAVGYHEDIWMSAMAVAMTGVISGSILAGKHFTQRAQAEGQVSAKPYHEDADAFDVAGSRG